MGSDGSKKNNSIKVLSILCATTLVITVGNVYLFVSDSYRHLPMALKWVTAVVIVVGCTTYVLPGFLILLGVIGFYKCFKLFRQDDMKNAKGLKLLLILSCLCCICGVAVILIWRSLDINTLLWGIAGDYSPSGGVPKELGE